MAAGSLDYGQEWGPPIEWWSCFGSFVVESRVQKKAVAVGACLSLVSMLGSGVTKLLPIFDSQGRDQSESPSRSTVLANALLSVMDRSHGGQFETLTSFKEKLTYGWGSRKTLTLQPIVARICRFVNHNNKIKATTIYYLRRTVDSMGKSGANL